MKAAVIDRYGGNDVVEVRDMPQPRCGAGSVLIKVRAAGVNPVDWKIRSGMLRIFTGSKFPRILGSECSGEVAETGGTLRFKKGDPVIGFPGTRSLGAFAEYVCSPETATFAKPEGLSFEEAACIPIAGLTALQALRDHGRIAPGKNVLVNGASGGVGSFAVQIAKTFGAEVTAVCSAANIELVKSLGADLVIDYGKEDFTKGNSQYDIIFDAVAKRSFGECRKVLAPKGVYVSTLPSFSVVLNQYLTGRLSGRKARAVMVAPTAADMEWMKAHLETGRVKVVIDSVFPLDRSKEALARSEAGRAKGKIVISAVRIESSAAEFGGPGVHSAREGETLLIDSANARLFTTVYPKQNAETVILLHGGPGVPMDFSPVAELLLRKFQVIAFDQRGTGRSPAAEGATYSIDEYLADINAIARHFGVDTFHLFGHSWGGLYAQIYAEAYPRRVLSMFLSSPSSGTGGIWKQTEREVMAFNRKQAGLWGWLKMGVKAAFGMLGSDAAYRSLFKQVLKNYHKDFDPTFVAADAMVANVRAEPINKTRRHALRYPMLKDAVDYPFPIMITYGERDIYGESKGHVKKRFPSATVVEIENAGHMPWRHNKQKFNNVLAAFYGIGKTGK